MIFGLLFACSCSSKINLNNQETNATNTPPIDLSVSFIEAVKENSNFNKYVIELEQLNPDSLKSHLKYDIQKKAFWINIYNAFIQLKLKEDSSLYESRNSFFSEKDIKIAGEDLSFDQIEHGILRKSAFKLGLGYIKTPFASDFVKDNEVSAIDYRIHFALSCGAISCPSIAILDAKNFDIKINKLSKSFLDNTSDYLKEKDEVSITTLFSWFRGDFGGKDGTLDVLKRYEIIPDSSEAKIEYIDYDWTLSLGNYYD